jgi:hypothetical protein
MLNVENEADKALLMNLCKTSKLTLSHFCWFMIFFSGERKIESLELRGHIYSVRKTSGGLRKIDTENYLFIEQNPQKDSEWGKLARSGYKIMWIIRKADNKFIGKVMDGTLEQLVKEK